MDIFIFPFFFNILTFSVRVSLTRALPLTPAHSPLGRGGANDAAFTRFRCVGRVAAVFLRSADAQGFCPASLREGRKLARMSGVSHPRTPVEYLRKGQHHVSENGVKLYQRDGQDQRNSARRGRWSDG